jgi:hypothetical protein
MFKVLLISYWGSFKTASDACVPKWNRGSSIEVPQKVFRGTLRTAPKCIYRQLQEMFQNTIRGNSAKYPKIQLEAMTLKPSGGNIVY